MCIIGDAPFLRSKTYGIGLGKGVFLAGADLLEKFAILLLRDVLSMVEQSFAVKWVGVQTRSVMLV